MAQVEKLVGIESPLEVGQKINEIIEKGVGGAFNLFDTMLKDHVLTYEETYGWALQGTYVYKEAVAGSRYGYPDFYNKCVEEFENSEYKMVDFVQPILSSNGTLGGDTFAVSANQEHNSGSSIYYAYYCFANNGNTSETTSWQTQALPASFTIYNPVALNITNIQITNRLSYPRAIASGTVLGSNNNDTWEEITSFTNTNNTASAIWSIDLSANTKFYKYYKLDNLVGIDAGLVGIGKINITATYRDVLSTNTNGHLFYDIADKAQIDELYNTNGIAWYYGIDTENERVFLPRTKWFIQPTGEITEVNSVNEAGLPNITGGTWLRFNNGSTIWVSATSGAISGGGNGSCENQGYGGTAGRPAALNFDASLSNPIYGNSDTVQPQSINQLLYICVGNTNVESAVTDVVDVTTTENDTIPLLTGMYFDFTPNNVSWLKAGQQANSGGIYTFTYNELVNCLNGETKYGDLKVIDVADMVTGVDYSLYWKVNQTDMTFITPTAISNKALSGGVKGNGMAMGLQRDAKAQTLDMSQMAVVASGSNDYATAVAYNAEKSPTYPLGITTDPTKSGIIAEESTAQLYFKVANAVQNLELLDAGEVLEAVNNVVPDNRELITGWAFPSDKYIDLTLGASGTEYTAPANGWYCFAKSSTGASQRVALFNLKSGTNTIIGSCAYAGTTGQSPYVSVPVVKGDVIQVSYTVAGSTNIFRFIYAQGEV